MNILESRRAAPANPKEAGERLEPEKRHSWYAISYDVHKYEITCTGLLSTNRQIFLEVVEMIQRQNRTIEGGFEYKLDLMARDQMLWPTWISLPVPIRYFKTLKVDFRDFNGERSLRWSGCGGPGAIVRYVLEILSQFLLRGPQFVCGECNREDRLCDFCSRKRIHVETLDITYITMRGGLQPLQFYPSWLDEYEEEYDEEHIQEEAEENAEEVAKGTPNEDGDKDSRRPIRQHLEQESLNGLNHMCGLLVGSGLLYGRVECIKLHCNGESKEWRIEDKDAAEKIKTAKSWGPYGWMLGAS